MARPKEFDQETALRKAIGLFSKQGFAATSTDDLMRVMDVGRQSMYDTFGDKRALFLKALVTFAERKDMCSAEGCMGLNAIGEFGQRDEDVSRITRKAARLLRQTL